MKLTLDNEFKTLISPLTSEEYNQLEESIKQEGCRNALVVWDNILLDGHNRLKICDKHNIEYKTTTINLPDRNAAKIWILKNQLGRRNLTLFRKAEIGLTLESIIAGEITEKAKEKQKEAGGAVPQKSAKAPVNTREEFAKIVGVSHDTISKTIDRAIMQDTCTMYRGFHLLQFENTTPNDGKTFLDGKEINRNELIKFLKFEQPFDWYLKFI